MFASAKLTEHPKYITTAGFGCVFSNYGLGPGTPEEPTIITKFFGDEYSYTEEKESHKNVIDRCGKFSTMNSIFGVDLNPDSETKVKGYNESINVKGKSYKQLLTGKTVNPVETLSKKPEFRDVSPSLVCQTPNYKGLALKYPVYSVKENGETVYPVVKMNNLGVELFDDPANLTVNSFIQIFELLALLHTGMIHNDIKGNNMLVSPLTGKVSLIDFGLCKPFDATSTSPPYHERSYMSLHQVWYAYPPEYTFLRSSRTEFRDPELDIEYVKQYIDHYENIKKHFNWPFHPFLDVGYEKGEGRHGREKRVTAALKYVYNQYFKPGIPNRLSNPHIFLQTAVTGDTYTIGLESFYYYGRVYRPDHLSTNQMVSLTMVKVNKNREINGQEFIDTISILLTALNPRYRPFHINIVKLYRHYNKALVEGATTTVNVNGSPYMELSILNGMPSTIDVAPGMALGMEGCPIPKEEVENNLKLLYYFLQHDMDTVMSFIYSDNNSYDSLLEDANNHIKTIMPSLFFKIKARIPSAFTLRTLLPPTPSPTTISPGTISPLTDVDLSPVVEQPVAMAVPVPVENPTIRAQRLMNTVPEPAPEARRIVAAPGPRVIMKVDPPVAAPIPIKPIVRAQRLMDTAAFDKYPDYMDLPVANMFSRRAPHRGGGDRKTLSIYTGDKGGLIKNLIEAGLLSPGVYMSAIRKSPDSAISEKVFSMLQKKQTGGDIDNTPLNTQKINNKQTKKLNRSSNKLNNTRRNNVMSTGQMPKYSEMQTNVFINNIGTSTTPGKINILHAYYISHLPVEEQKKIMKLLFFVPLADPAVIRNIVSLLSSQSTGELINYLNGLKSEHISEVASHMPLDVMKGGGADIDELVESYVNDNDNDRYRSLLSTFREMSRQMMKSTSANS